ncbi:MAG: hypothetical protein RL339_2549, partial [Pseudomonadota bacterium]
PQLLGLCLLTACGDAAAPETTPLRDPAIMGALSESLLSDPDLVGASRNATMLAGGGPAEGGVPLFGPDEKEAARARDEAARLLGGAIAPAPRAEAGADISVAAKVQTAAGVAGVHPFAAKCAASLDYSFAWAARFPAALPVYPRAHAQEAGGSDAAGCKLRVINFRTPVSVNDVVDFYHASAARAGLVPRVAKAGADLVISGGKGGLAFAVHVRPMADGITEVDLITNG